MGLTPEGKVKAKISAMLKKHNAYYDMPVSNGMGKPTLDYVICSNGYYMGLEAKAPGKKPTPRQLLTMKVMADAGGAVMVVHDEDPLDALESWLNLTQLVPAPDAIKLGIAKHNEEAAKQAKERPKYDH